MVIKRNWAKIDHFRFSICFMLFSWCLVFDAKIGWSLSKLVLLVSSYSGWSGCTVSIESLRPIFPINYLQTITGLVSLQADQGTRTRPRLCVRTMVTGHLWGCHVEVTWSPVVRTPGPMCSMWQETMVMCHNRQRMSGNRVMNIIITPYSYHLKTNLYLFPEPSPAYLKSSEPKLVRGGSHIQWLLWWYSWLCVISSATLTIIGILAAVILGTAVLSTAILLKKW